MAPSSNHSAGYSLHTRLGLCRASTQPGFVGEAVALLGSGLDRNSRGVTHVIQMGAAHSKAAACQNVSRRIAAVAAAGRVRLLAMQGCACNAAILSSYEYMGSMPFGLSDSTEGS